MQEKARRRIGSSIEAPYGLLEKKIRHSGVFVLGVACLFSFSFCERGQLCFFFLKKKLEKIKNVDVKNCGTSKADVATFMRLIESQKIQFYSIYR